MIDTFFSFLKKLPKICAPPFLNKYTRHNNKHEQDDIQYVDYKLGAVVKAEHGRGIILGIIDHHLNFNKENEYIIEYTDYKVHIVTEKDLNKYNYKQHIFLKDLANIVGKNDE